MNKLTRRQFIGYSGTALIGMTVGGVSLRSFAQEKIDIESTSAKALKYVHKSTTEGQNCASCMHIKGAEEEWRPCALFPNQLVNNEGWCAAWMKKPG